MATKKTSAAKSSATKKAAAKKTTAKKSAAKKATAAKATSKSSAGSQSSKAAAGRKSAARSPAARSAAAGKAKGTAGQHAAPKKTSSPDKYTDPALRERIKAKVLREDKGGRAGQWSARKAQMVAHEYEAEGGKYKGGRDATQQNLTAWGDEHWTTQDGKPANREDGMHRYLPEKAWDKLSPAEKKATEEKKHEGDRKGEQYVANTASAVKARRGAEKKAEGH